MNPRERYDSLFRFYAGKHALDWKLLKCQALQESRLDPHAVNKRSGAAGLTQFMPKTWEEWKDGTPGIQTETEESKKLSVWNPEDSISAQAAYMASLVRFCEARLQTTDYRFALACYNWGMGNVQKLVQQKGSALYDLIYTEMPDETIDYVERIYKFMFASDTWEAA